jgi:hypothetical protein
MTVFVSNQAPRPATAPFQMTSSLRYRKSIILSFSRTMIKKTLCKYDVKKGHGNDESNRLLQHQHPPPPPPITEYRGIISVFFGCYLTTATAFTSIKIDNKGSTSVPNKQERKRDILLLIQKAVTKKAKRGKNRGSTKS